MKRKKSHQEKKVRHVATDFALFNRDQVWKQFDYYYLCALGTVRKEKDKKKKASKRKAESAKEMSERIWITLDCQILFFAGNRNVFISMFCKVLQVIFFCGFLFKLDLHNQTQKELV